MRVLLKLVLPCEPDAAWAALRNPEALRAISSPLMTLRSLEPGGFPRQWQGGAHRVELRLAGLIPAGIQVIDVTLTQRDGVRMLRDSGGGETGLLGLVTGWRHRMAVSAAPGGGTLYRDELRFSAGILSPLLWPAFWAFWQWRALRLRGLAAQLGPS